MPPVNPYQIYSYLGEFATDAAALAYIQACLWDSLGDGTGTPRLGMRYWCTTAPAHMRWWYGTAWGGDAHAYLVGSYSPNTAVSQAAAVWNYGVWFILLPKKSQWDFARYNYYYVVNGFKNGAGTGQAQLYYYNHATGPPWLTVPSSLINNITLIYRQWWSGVLDLSAVADEDDLYWSPSLLGDGANQVYMCGAAVYGVPK